MQKRMLIFSLLILLSAVARAQDPDSDETKIREQLAGWADAWNRGDAKAVAAYYTEDADRTFPNGVVQSGRSRIHDIYRDAFAAPLAEGVEHKLTMRVLSVRLLTADAAVVNYEYQATGIPMVPGVAVTGRTALVMVKQAGEWLRSAQTNWIPTTPECYRRCTGQ